MTVISLCKGDKHGKICPKRNVCERFIGMKDADPIWQSWTHSPFTLKKDEFRCDMFLPIEDGEE